MYYKKHIFFCFNNKPNQSGCGDVYTEDAFGYVKMYLQAIEQWGEGKIRASKAGCLGRCTSAPACVVYPEGTWYSYLDNDDLKEIVDEHLLNNREVARLKLD